jgi:hypothetical protein
MMSAMDIIEYKKDRVREKLKHELLHDYKTDLSGNNNSACMPIWGLEFPEGCSS